MNPAAGAAVEVLGDGAGADASASDCSDRQNTAATDIEISVSRTLMRRRQLNTVVFYPTGKIKSTSDETAGNEVFK
jgi:hypothetical protein